MQVAWFQKLTIQRKTKFTVMIGILIFILFFVWLMLSRGKKELEWSPSTVLEINSKDYYIFVNPKDAYSHIALNKSKLVSPESINQHACDCKIDGDKILVAYINSKLPNELVFKVIVPDNLPRRVVLETLSDKRIRNGAYPKIYISDEAYYVLSGVYLYKINKIDFQIEQIQMERNETPLITSDDRVFLRRGEFLTLLQKDSHDEKILKLDSTDRVSGWGIEGKTVLLNKGNTEELVSLKDETPVKLRTPSYGILNVIGNIGHLAIVQFYHKNGEVPICDPALGAYSFIDGINYWYYRPYLYDVEQNKFYDIPDEIKKLYPNKDDALTGYCAPANLKQIEAELHQYLEK